ncbi:MAG: beta-galactosidase [Verrucomicrobiia bacterium]
MKTRYKTFFAALAIIFLLCLAVYGQRPLVNFGGGFDGSLISATDAKFEIKRVAGGAVLSVITGNSSAYPGVTIRAPQKSWDLSEYDYVEAVVKNVGDGALTLNCRVDNPGADGNKNCVNGTLNIPAGQSRSLRVRLVRYTDDNLGGKLFGMRGYPKKAGGDRTVEPSNIVQVLFFVNKPSRTHRFEIHSIVAGGVYVAPTAWTSDANPFFPFIDTFGQYKHKNWEGKTVSFEDMQAKRKAEEKELAAMNEPDGWDKYGGWAKGPKLEATGFFRAQKINGKWWLIDPEGHLFFSHGVDCVRMTDATPIEEREEWFDQPPWNSPEFEKFITRGNCIMGHYANRSVRCFSFGAANFYRKYGENWQEVYPEIIQKRLRSWGFNTIGNWSDERVRLMRKTPYTDSISSGRTPPIQGSEGYWGKFPDVFDASFEANVRRSMESKKGKSANDPWCIGYFSDNEMSWGDEYSLAIAALKSPPEQAVKKVFIEKLKTKYNSIEALNKEWGTKYESWEAVQKSQMAPDRTRAAGDLRSFYTTIAEQYFKTVRKVIKEIAPNQLYLGCRFAWVNPLAAAAAAKYCDVVSYNIYKRDVKDFQFNGGADVPLIIGEFHFGALDRGMFHTGLVPTASQKERATAYLNYVKSVIEHPSFVGCHWFQYQDQPTIGRVLDGENYQIGLVDIADTPYKEMIEAARQVPSLMYRK